MAGDPAFTEVLLGMGLRSFSMHPAQISSIKQRILRADARRCASVMPDILVADDPETRSRFAREVDMNHAPMAGR
jgi:phosphotransferase system enzyme I (PtsI)